MLTEQEAQSKWCPWARVQEFDARGNRSAQNDIPRGCFCIASQCMAWRWQPTHVNNPDDPKGDLIWSARTYGFCGLAGDSPPLAVGAPPK